MDTESSVGADEVIIELLQELVQQGRARRAESVMAPPAAETPAPAGDDEMAELEQMMADPGEASESPAEEADPKAETAEGEPCPNCGKSPCEC